MKITNDFGNKLKGSIGEQVTASEWNGRNYLKAYARPSNTSTPQQEEKRTFLADGMAVWQGFHERQKEAYLFESAYLKNNLPPLNTFLKYYLERRNAGLGYTAPDFGAWGTREVGPGPSIYDATITVYRGTRTTPYAIVQMDGVFIVTRGLVAEEGNWYLCASHPDFVTKCVGKTASNPFPNTFFMTPI